MITGDRTVRNILVTGASGFVGSHLVRRLLSDGHTVVGVTGPSSRGERLVGLTSGFTARAADLCSAREAEALFAKSRFDIVYHLAARGVDSRDGESAALAVNTCGALNIARAALAAGVRRFVHCGSGLEYRSSAWATSESVPLAPANLYGATKAAGWLQLECLARTEGLPLVTVRLFTVYGPGESGRKLIPWLITRGLRGDPISLTSGEQVRDFLFVSDAVEALRLAGEASAAAGSVFNIGAGPAVACSVRAVAETVLDLAAAPRSLCRFGALRHGRVDPAYLVADATLAAGVLGWKPRVSLETGLRRTIDSLAPLAALELASAAGGGR